MKKIALIILVLIVIVFIAVLAQGKLMNSTPKETHVVTLTKDGFSPEAVSVKKGDTVTFKTTSKDPFWPASNIHPTHGIYPEFDPKDAIFSDKTWSFKFEKVGKWSYHDHLAPYFTGTITVTN